MLSKFRKHHHHRGLRRLPGGDLRWTASSATATATPTAGPPLPSPAEDQYRNQQAANDHLSSLCKRRLHREALRAFYSFQLRRTPLQLYPSTYAHLLLACSAVKSLPDGRRIRRHLAQCGGAPPDVILHNHLLNMYGKCGAMEEARKLFEEMPERNLVSWTSLLTGLSQNGREKEAAALYREMLRCGGVSPDEFTLGSVLRACAALADGELCRQLHAHALKKSPAGADRIVQNALIAAYFRAGRAAEAAAVFSKIRNKDLISWGSIIAGYSQQGFCLEALEVFRAMLAGGEHFPNEFLFGSAFSACGALAQLGYGEELHGLCLKLGWAGDACAGSALADMYARCGQLGAARRAFRRVELPDAAAWNAIIAACAYAGEADEAVELFSEMAATGARPDDLTVRCLLCGFAGRHRLVQGQLLHAQSLKLGFLPDLQVCNTLLAMYGKCSEISLVFHLFGEMKNQSRDLVSWNTLLSACLQENQLEEVLRQLPQLMNSGHRPDQITISIVLSAGSALGYLEMTIQLHAHSVKTGWEADQWVTNDLIDAYCKCGSPDEARKLLRRQDVVAWTSLIMGHAQCGRGRDAVALFGEMLAAGVEPNEVTFVGVLSACGRAGLVEEGRQVFESMRSGYGVEPTREHYSCMVDLLARAGWLREAEELMEVMPFEPDAVAWKALLAACRARGELGVAERAAGRILQLDPGNSAAHVLLCGVYASQGRWEEAAGMRRRMRSSGVRKAQGKSWIKVNGAVRVFVVEDRSHPETERIYSVLFDLRREMSRTRQEAAAAAG